MRTRDVCVLDL